MLSLKITNQKPLLNIYYIDFLQREIEGFFFWKHVFCTFSVEYSDPNYILDIVKLNYNELVGT